MSPPDTAARNAVRAGRLVPAVALACAGCFGSAHGAKWTLEPVIGARATYTDNVSFEDRSQKESDTFFELTPALSLRGEGKRFRVFGNVAVTGVTYANGSRSDRALPSANLTANLEAIERLFFVEAGVVSRQEAEDVFGPRPDGRADFNSVTTTQYRLIPTFEGRVGADLSYRLSSNNSWTSVTGAESDADGAYFGDHTLRIERSPTPFGWRIEAGRNDTRFESTAQASAVLDSGRIALLHALTPTLNLGLRGGYEKTNLVVENDEQAIYGAEVSWRPSERTNLNAVWEERFFGNGWRLAFNHRMPRLAWNVAFSRDVASFPQAFLTLPPTDNVAALLDAAFTTRFPDPAERGRVVSDLIARQGLPPSLTSQTVLFSQRVSLITSRSASIAYLGVRNSIALNGFSSQTEDLPDSIFAPAAGASNVVQDGGSLTFSHQLTTLSSVNVTASRTRTRGRGADEGLQSKQTVASFQVTQQLAPKTSAFIGARAQKFDSNVDVEAARENAAFVGLAHRF